MASLMKERNNSSDSGLGGKVRSVAFSWLSSAGTRIAVPQIVAQSSFAVPARNPEAIAAVPMQ